MIGRLRRVDRTRFKDLTYPHLGFLFNMALKYTGKSYDAEDIVQETMYLAYRNFHQLRDEEKCRQWLFAILRTTFLKEKRSFTRRPLLDDGSGYLKHLTDESADSLALLFEKKMDREDVQYVLERMTEKHKSPLILYYMEDMTYQEIADYLEIPIGTVMSRLARAKKQMKKELLKKLAKKQKKSNLIFLATLLFRGVL
jgi:RNA polymerase sigma-70 factor (ECF subfamily)